MALTASEAEHVEEMLEDIAYTLELQVHSISKWEEEFYTSVKGQFEERGDLSAKQILILERIWTKL